MGLEMVAEVIFCHKMHKLWTDNLTHYWRCWFPRLEQDNCNACLPWPVLTGNNGTFVYGKSWLKGAECSCSCQNGSCTPLTRHIIRLSNVSLFLPDMHKMCWKTLQNQTFKQTKLSGWVRADLAISTVCTIIIIHPSSPSKMQISLKIYFNHFIITPINSDPEKFTKIHDHISNLEKAT